MFHGSLDIDLPSAPYPSSGRVASMLRWVLVGPDPRQGRERLVEQGLSVFDRLLRGLEASGFNDMINVLVAGKAAFVDLNEKPEDLHEAFDKVLASGALRNGLKDFQLSLSRRTDVRHTVVTATVNEEVVIGDEEIHLRSSARLSSLRIVRGEGPVQYRARVQAFLEQGRFDTERSGAQADLDRLRETLTESLRPNEIRGPSVVAQLVVPGPTQLGRLRHLSFGSRVRKPTYRPGPQARRTGAYDDPQVYHYFDPYHDLLGWILAEAIAEGRWDANGVRIVDPSGEPVTPSLEELREQLTLKEDRVVVSDDVPLVGLDHAEAGSPHTPGWGGEDFGE